MIDKHCKHCAIVLSGENRAQNRLECKPCRSTKVVEFMQSIPEHRRRYANEYARRVGRVKQYPCEVCQTLCYKKYELAFCKPECRLMHYVKKENDCWLWTGGINRRGYGKTCFNGKKYMAAHRASFIVFKGPIEEGKLVLHSCHQPSCINPEHLRLGTAKDNSIDMINAGRSLRGEKSLMSRLTSEQVIEIRKLNESMTQYKIAELFNVTAGHLNNIIKRRVWKHI